MILVGGEALYDLVLDGTEELRAHPGGGPFTTARTVARLRQPVAYLGRLSTDGFGRRLRSILSDDGVLLDAVVSTEDLTTLALADVDAGGNAVYRFYERATSVPGLTAEAALAALPAAVGVVHVGSLGLILEPIATALEAVVAHLRGSALIVVDPNVRPASIADPGRYRARLDRVFADSDLIKLSEDDLAWLDPDRSPVEAARSLLALGPRVVLLTRGPAGALVLTAAGETAVPAPAVTVVDTIGAGDAFGGGFLAWWQARGLGRDELADFDLVVEATRFATLVAGRTCERAGASPPFLEELG